jgi:hypothetical protein
MQINQALKKEIRSSNNLLGSNLIITFSLSLSLSLSLTLVLQVKSLKNKFINSNGIKREYLKESRFSNI